jgi:hypothetical protein
MFCPTVLGGKVVGEEKSRISDCKFELGGNGIWIHGGTGK